MSKAILVMDMPSCCDECDVICTQYYTAIKDKNFENYMKPNNCPLREVPQKKDYDYCDRSIWTHERIGYNACIDEIMKGSEEKDERTE